MNLSTPRFGTISYTDEQVVRFPAGLRDTPQSNGYLVVDDPATAPFQWLVCVERPEYTVAVLDPSLVLDECANFSGQSHDTTTFVVATPGIGAVAWWLDLCHPILINIAERTGEQVTLDDSTLPEKFPVTLHNSHETAG